MNIQAAKLFSQIILADNLHPNDRGYEVMFRLLMRELGIAVPHPEMKTAE